MKPLGTKEALVQLNLNQRPTFLYEYIKPALENNLIEMTHPDKPTSPRQKYRVVDFRS
jgi:hypothetical protein